MGLTKLMSRDCIRKLYFIFKTQLGVDPRSTIRFLLGIPHYMHDFLRFRSNYTGRFELLPCLHDWREEGGATNSEYFWQDLIVAKKIFESKPEKHVDIGSRIDGFVAHVASFRELEVFDVRPISPNIPGVVFKQTDFMQPMQGMHEYCDSLSCLHALEHFGLGRYGDPIDPVGAECGLVNMSSLLKKDGLFYLSVPIGIDRVEFNANRIFDPRVIINLATENSLRISSLTVIHQGKIVELNVIDDVTLSGLANQRYALGIFIFIKIG